MRYRPEIQWSKKSWTHNIFRLYELIFGRKEGIRAEISSWYDGNRAYFWAHSFEGACALIETSIRELLHFRFSIKKIYIPKLVTANGFPTSSLPFIFSIAVDSTSSGSDSSSGGAWNITWNHTCTGSNLVLVVSSIVGSASSINAATYNSVIMTTGITRNDQYRLQLDYLANPATGSNQVKISGPTTANQANGGAISFSGANTTTPLEGTGYNVSDINVSVITSFTNTMVVDAVAVNNVPTITVGASQTQIFQSKNSETKASSYKQQVSPGTLTMGWTGQGSNSRNGIAIGIGQFIFTRNPSDSILTGASRTVDLTAVQGILRSLADNILNGASRTANLFKGSVQNLSDNIMNGAARLTTLSRFASMTRLPVDSIMNAYNRFANLFGFKTWNKRIPPTTTWTKRDGEIE